MGYPRIIHGALLKYSWAIHRLPMEYHALLPWATHALPVDSPRAATKPHRVPIRCLWGTPGMGLGRVMYVLDFFIVLHEHPMGLNAQG